MNTETKVALIVFAMTGCTFFETPESSRSETVNAKPIRSQRKHIHEYFPGKLHPNISRVRLYSRHDPDEKAARVGEYELDGQDYPSMKAILKELDGRKQRLKETGVWYFAGEKIVSDPVREASTMLRKYCKKNDIDLFVSYALGLPPIDGGTNTYWVVESSTTKYVLPAESRNKREYLEF